MKINKKILLYSAILALVPTTKTLADINDSVSVVDKAADNDQVAQTEVAQTTKSSVITITFADKNGRTIETQQIKNVVGAAFNSNYLNIPSGYNISNNSMFPTEFKDYNQKFVITVLKNTTVNVLYVDNNGQSVGSGIQTLSGRVGDKLDINQLNIPYGYLIDKADLPISYTEQPQSGKIILKKISNSSSTAKSKLNSEHKFKNTSHLITSRNNYLQIVENTSVQVYNNDLNPITGKTIPANTSWYTDKNRKYAGDSYQRISTSEWIKVNNSIPFTINVGVITVNNSAQVYSTSGAKVTTKVLTKNTKWATDRVATINGHKMYRVSTYEWVKASDTTFY